MKRATGEWIERAEGDRRVAERELGSSDPVWNVVCFLSEQCAQKYLKAFLEENNIAFGKTHDLVVLVDLAEGRLSELDSLKPDLAQLGPLGISVRYPGPSAGEVTARNAFRIAQEVREVLRARLGGS